MESILTTIKKMLGITEECIDFDETLIVHINSALSILPQISVISSVGIDGDITMWCDLMVEPQHIEFIKAYVYYRVRLAFDPPTSSALLSALKAQCDELEWRIMVSIEADICTQ